MAIDEKVLIERLEEYKYTHLVACDSERLEHCKENEKDCEGNDCFLCVWEKAIEIVKDLASEHNNGFCEWRKENSNKYVCDAHAEIHDSRVLDWCVCPYCGKKIKEVRTNRRNLPTHGNRT